MKVQDTHNGPRNSRKETNESTLFSKGNKKVRALRKKDKKNLGSGMGESLKIHTIGKEGESVGAKEWRKVFGGQLPVAVNWIVLLSIDGALLEK